MLACVLKSLYLLVASNLHVETDSLTFKYNGRRNDTDVACPMEYVALFCHPGID